MATWLMINGSPRANGTSARVARILEARIAQERPDVELKRFDVSDNAFAGCNGCEYCETEGCCIIGDDMDRLLDDLLSVDRVLVVCPIYFAGPPSQFKAILDRMQPLFWKREDLKASGAPLAPKRPAVLYAIGDGGDPHGYAPLEAIVRSAFALADLRVESTHPLIGLKRIGPSDIVIP